MGSRSTAGGGAVTLGSALAAAKPVTKSITLSLDGELVDEIERLTEQLRHAAQADDAENREPEAPKIAARIVDLTEQARAGEVLFTFRSIGRRAWRDLVAEHPPTEEQKAEGADVNPETFPIAAMLASCVAPADVTKTALERLADEVLTDEQWNRLWLTCHGANTGGADIPLSAAAYALARGTETSSARRGSTAPPEASS